MAQYLKRHSVYNAQVWTRPGDHPEVLTYEQALALKFWDPVPEPVAAAGYLYSQCDECIYLVFSGDWIVTDDDGDSRIYCPNLFTNLFETVEEALPALYKVQEQEVAPKS